MLDNVASRLTLRRVMRQTAQPNARAARVFPRGVSVELDEAEPAPAITTVRSNGEYSLWLAFIAFVSIGSHLYLTRV